MSPETHQTAAGFAQTFGKGRLVTTSRQGAPETFRQANAQLLKNLFGADAAPWDAANTRIAAGRIDVLENGVSTEVVLVSTEVVLLGVFAGEEELDRYAQTVLRSDDGRTDTQRRTLLPDFIFDLDRPEPEMELPIWDMLGNPCSLEPLGLRLTAATTLADIGWAFIN